MYQEQVRYQLLVAGIPKGWLLFFHEEKPIIRFEITLTESHAETLRQKAEEFWHMVQKGIEPEKDS